MLGMLGLGAAGIVVGARTQNELNHILAPINSGISGLVPAAGGFRIYSVTGSVKNIHPAEYNLTVGGLVQRPATLSYAELTTVLPQTHLVRDFQCVTGWRVPHVAWTGVSLPDLLNHVGVAPGAKALKISSFDGAYTDSLTLSQARRRDIIVATSMLGAPVTHDHGGPVRLYVAPMYGYKSVKWLSRIDLVDKVEAGYWENEGYDIDGWVGHSNGRSDAPT
jgi:DMSO/TMAO reductase YedYZ molybdopterin-dependent catalytic subunit